MSFMLLLIAVIGGVVFIYNSPMFEQDAPVATIEEDNGYWNMREPLHIKIDDASGLLRYKIMLKSPERDIELASEQFMSPDMNTMVTVDVPKSAFRLKVDSVQVVIEATDASKWNFLAGNSSHQTFEMVIDKKRPLLSNITNSYGIRQGGSALVVFRAHDENMKEFYIESRSGRRFASQPFYKEGYYVSLIGWPVMEDDFKVSIVAEDKAGNVSRAAIPFYIKPQSYRTRDLRLSDKYLEGKIAQLAYDYPETQGVDDRIEQFKIINEEVRGANERLIHSITSKVGTEMISDFSIDAMYPLKNASVLGGFGDHRYYYYQGQKVSEAYHLGLDMASVKQAKIIPQNGGEVVYADYNGIYGNMPIISHGLGLYTLYAHCSNVNVHEGEQIAAHTVIANTGTTGSVLGDHLHFGVLVQGVDVRPQEWMDAQWIRLNITEVMKNARQIISRQ